ncbi:hypothetical protein BDN72DRAFT_906241 [Pluteus cervinus]|uniref:Uncharacterized protein n=1 Tax=Pluteus cervinus TaxID=181527 RepID=A0ACD3A013_9AGAR|nr:hypothetical protein BDN72DRAFT_906241 [Pluteus cervinus]
MAEMPISVPDELQRFYALLQTMEENIGVLDEDATSAVKTLLECKGVLAGLSTNLKLLRQRLDVAVIAHGGLEVCAAQLEKTGKLDIMRSILLKHVTEDLPSQTPASTASTPNQVASERGQRKRPRTQDNVNSLTRSKLCEAPAGTATYHLGG